jgi:hypothetical protein
MGHEAPSVTLFCPVFARRVLDALTILLRNWDAFGAMDPGTDPQLGWMVTNRHAAPKEKVEEFVANESMVLKGWNDRHVDLVRCHTCHYCSCPIYRAT